MTEPDCQCAFEYQYRWPQFYDALLSTDPERRATAVELLDERDRALEQHFNERCDEGGDFEYPTRWSQITAGLLSADTAVAQTIVSELENRDQALQTHIAGLPCFGIDYARGVTCEFEYPTRWSQLAPMLLSGDVGRLREAVALLQVRDIELETHLTNRVCRAACATDDFDRADGPLGADWADVAVHKAPYTHAPFAIQSGVAVGVQDLTGPNAWSETRYARLTTAPDVASFIETEIHNPFAAAVPSDTISVRYELFLDLAADGSCETLGLEFVTTGAAFEGGRCNASISAFRADGTNPSVPATATFPFYFGTSPVAVRFESDGSGSYRGLFDGIEFISGTQTVDGPSGTSVGFGSTRNAAHPSGIDTVTACGHGLARGTLFFTDDCENFTDAPWVLTGSSPGPTIAPGRVGNGFSIPRGSSNTVSYNLPADHQTDRLTIGMWLYLPHASLLSTVLPVLSFRSDSGATEHVALRLDNAGFVEMRRGDGVSLGLTGGGLFATDTWQYFEVTVHLDDVHGSFTVQVNGTTVSTWTNEDTRNGGTKTVFDEIRFYGVDTIGGATPPYLIDDITLRDDNLLAM